MVTRARPEAATARNLAGRLREATAADRPYLVRLLRTLVSTESHASQPAGVNAVGEQVAVPLQEAGFRCERLRPLPLPPESGWLAEVMLPGGDFTTVGDIWRLERPGPGEPVLLLGDLDTAFPAGSAERFPFRVDGDIAFGPGVADMKGGLVTLVGAARAVKAARCPVPRLVAVLSPDEQAGSLVSRAVIEHEARRSRACLCMECAREGGNLMGSRAHAGVAKIEVFGRDAHAGTEHERGVSALRAFARAVDAIEKLTDHRAGRLVTITQVHAGWRRSVVPGRCVALVDVRARSDRSWRYAEGRLRKIVSDRVERDGVRADVKTARHRPGFSRTQRSEELIGLVTGAAELLGLEVGVIGSHAAGSSAFAAPAPVADGMGPPGCGLMTDHEQISLTGLIERASMLALSLAMLADPSLAPANHPFAQARPRTGRLAGIAADGGSSEHDPATQ